MKLCTTPPPSSRSARTARRFFRIQNECAYDEGRVSHFRLEVVTPKHGSWLNMAEYELSVLSRQCLARRIPNQTELADAVEALETTRNGTGSRRNWQFTT